MTDLNYLVTEIEQLAPVDGVSIGSWQDKTTWRVDYKASATPGERNAVSAFINSLNANTPTINDVRSEAQRRIIALVGARDATDLGIKIQNALRETARLLEKEVSGVALTPQEKTRKQTLMTMDAAIEAIRAASNTLEAMTPVPADYTNDSRWP